MEPNALTLRWGCLLGVLSQALSLFLALQVSPAIAQGVPPSTLAVEGSTLRPEQQNGKWGYVDSAGTFLIPPQFDSTVNFSEGVAAVELNGRFGYINVDAHFVIDPKYFRAAPFKDGFAWVVVRKPWFPFGTGEYGVALYGRVTYIDHSGREMRHPFSAEGVSNFSEGLAAVRPGKIFGGCSEKVGYLNVRGKWGIEPQFDDASDFSEGLAAVNQGAKCHMGGKWGYIDKDGRVAVPVRYDFAAQFKRGQACVQ